MLSPYGEVVYVALRGGVCPNNTRALNFSHCLDFCAEVDLGATTFALATFEGKALAPAAATACVEVTTLSKGSLAATAAQVTLWLSDSGVSAKAAGGAGASGSLVVTVGGQVLIHSSIR